jgi:hypothetical protein
MIKIRLSKNRVTLYAYTAIPGLAEYLPPARLTPMPAWRERLTSYIEPSYTSVTSPGTTSLAMTTPKQPFEFQQLLKRGVGVRLWSDIKLGLSSNGVSASCPSARKVGMVHPTSQHDGAIGPTGQHYKIQSPWSFVCDTPMHFLWTHPFYHRPDQFEFQTMPGIVEYCHQHKTNLNVVLSRTQSSLALNAGEMVAYLIPMFDATIRVVAEQVTELDMKRINFADNISSRPFLFRRKHGPLLAKVRRP